MAATALHSSNLLDLSGLAAASVRNREMYQHLHEVYDAVDGRFTASALNYDVTPPQQIRVTVELPEVPSTPEAAVEAFKPYWDTDESTLEDQLVELNVIELHASYLANFVLALHERKEHPESLCTAMHHVIEWAEAQQEANRLFATAHQSEAARDLATRAYAKVRRMAWDVAGSSYAAITEMTEAA